MSGLLWLLLSAVLLICDQLAKLWALRFLAPVGSIPVAGFLKFTYVENRGAAFGIFQGQTSLLAAVTVAILGGAVWLLFSGRVRLPLEKLCIALIIAGGAGNLYDRMIRGFVVDFIDINALFPYPMFNLADCFVVAGACLLILGVFLEESRQKKALLAAEQGAPDASQPEQEMLSDSEAQPEEGKQQQDAEGRE